MKLTNLNSRFYNQHCFNMHSKYINADCLNSTNGLSTYQDNYFDLAIVDVQFGIGEDGRKKRRDYSTQRNGKRLKVKCVEDSLWDDEQPTQEYFDELFRVSKYQIIFGCNYLIFEQKNTSSGRIIWDKVNGDNDYSDCEILWTNLFSSVRQIEYMWNGMMQGKSIKYGRIQQGNKKLNEKRIQNCQKPVLLYRWLLNLKQVSKTWRLLDTHVGSASSLIAFETEGFNYIGFEKDKAHYINSVNRMNRQLNKSQLKFELNG